MERIKLLFLIESLSAGGGEKVLVTLLNNIDLAKFDVTLCCISNKGQFNDDIRSDIKVIYLLSNPDNLNSFEKIFYKIKYYMIYKWLPLKIVYNIFIPKDSDIEIAFVEGFVTNLLSFSNNKRSRKIAWVHTDLANNHWISSIYKDLEEESISYNKYNNIVGVSDTVCKAFSGIYHLEDKIVKLYNPVDFSYIKKASQEQEIPLLSKESDIRIVSVGRFVPQKAFERLLRITYNLLKENYSIELWLIGDGPLRKEYESYIKENKLDKKVKLLGFQSNPYAYIRQCDIFVCSSICEGYSTAVTESLILGVPVITTECSGMDELLDNGKYGIITDNSEESLYYGVKRVINNPSVMNYYKQKANERGNSFKIKNTIIPIENFLIGG